MTTSLMNVRKISPLEEDSLGSLQALDRGDWVMHAHCRHEDPDALFAYNICAAPCRSYL
ncbi:Transcription factor WhiB [Corynebacterium pseudotuberculosis PAT10]|nr:Transcription factor WhiB [Corynebacterium pseudotuberculosis PAT10]